jgi:hypothetical protein
MFYRKLSLFATLTGLAAMTAFGQTTTPTASTRTLDLPPFGLGSTETARVNLTNVANASSAGTAASCTGNVSFVNAAGTAIGTATPFTLATGVTSSASLPFNSSGLTGVRGQLRAVVQVTRNSTTPTPCSLLISLETFETNTGATHIFHTVSQSFGGFGGGPGR